MVVCISNANTYTQKLEKYSQTNSNVKYILKVDITMSVKCNDCEGSDATQLCNHHDCKRTKYGLGVCDECVHGTKGKYIDHKFIPLSEAKKAAESDMDESFHRYLASRTALWKDAEWEEEQRFRKGDRDADEVFIYPPQEKDAMAILERASKHTDVLVEKELKLGAEGTILAIARAIETGKAPKDSGGRPLFTACICITGMGNNSWGESLIRKTGEKGWAADYVAHCGVRAKKDYRKLKNALTRNGNIMPGGNLQRCLIIMDECDLGDANGSATDNFLKEFGVQTIGGRCENECAQVSISATTAAPSQYLKNHCAQQQELELLGVLGATSVDYKLTVPDTYKGLRQFKIAQIIVPQLEGTSEQQVITWLGELKIRYSGVHRVHLFRLPKKEAAETEAVKTLLTNLGVEVGFDVNEYNSTDRKKSEANWKRAFEAARAGTASSILILKPNGLLGRATRIVPNDKKLVGSIYEAGTGANNDAIVQALIGRMCGHDFAAKKLVCATPHNQVTPEEHRMGPFYVKAGAADDYLKEKDGALEPDVIYTATGNVRMKGGMITSSRPDGSFADVPTAEGEPEGRSDAVKEYLLLGGEKVVEKTVPTAGQLKLIVTHSTLSDAQTEATKWLIDLKKRGCMVKDTTNDENEAELMPTDKYKSCPKHNPKHHTKSALWKAGYGTLRKGSWIDATTYAGHKKTKPVAIRKVSEKQWVVLVKLPVPPP